MRALMWFRSDLRIADNTALHHACREADEGVIAVFIICPKQWREHDWAEVKVDFILRNLQSLSDELKRLNIPLLIRETPSFRPVPRLLLDLARKHGCDCLHYNIEYEVNEARRDEAVARLLARHGLETSTWHDQCIIRPDVVRTNDDRFYTVFTPFKRRWIETAAANDCLSPVPRPRKQSEMMVAPDPVPDAVKGFDPPSSDSSMREAGEKASQRRLQRFVERRIGAYKTKRDIPGDDATSALSPHLAAGVISARQCLKAALEVNDGRIDRGRPGPACWITELIWREFYRHVLVGFPRVCMGRPFRLETERVKWRTGDSDFNAWREGRTGVPIVDAGMRQLAQTGWMHNRLRMITAMFLSKQLLIDWRRGERHFMRHLVDGDLASNNGGWQWAASTGTDAAPYFRIFNPIRQSEKFDPKGAYIRRFVEELRDVKVPAIHDPHARGVAEADLAGYPKPIVDLKTARNRAIEAFKAAKGDR